MHTYNMHVHKQEYEFFIHKCRASWLPNKEELISNSHIFDARPTSGL